MKRLKYIITAVIALAFIASLVWAGTPGKWKYGIRIRDEGAAHSTPPSGYMDVYVNGDALYVIDDSGVATDVLATSSATAWHNLAVPTDNEALNMGAYYTEWTLADTDHDIFTMFFTGAFTDQTGLLLEQKTGNPSNGTIFEIKMADVDPDFLSFATSGVEKVNIADNGDITLSAGDLTAVDATLSGNLSVGGTWAVNAIAADTATQTLTLDGETSGGVQIGATSTGNVTLGDDVVVSDGYNVTVGEGTLTVDNDAVDEWGLSITADAAATAGAIQVVSKVTTAAAGMGAISVTADDVTTGDLLLLDSTAAGMTTGNFINALNGATTVFEVGLYGATTIAGNASTDIVTVTAGDIEITAGDIDLNNGQLMVDSVQDLSNNISRNFAGAGGAAVLVVSDDHTSSTNTALDINQDGTGASKAMRIVHDGDGAAIDITAGAARTGNVIDIAMANMLNQNGLLIDGDWTGAATLGMVKLNPAGNIADTAAAVMIDYDTGTPVGHGFAITIDDDSADGGDLYALQINSANNEGLHVEAGVSLFAELTTFTAGVDSDAGIDMDTAANDVGLTLDSTATGGTAGIGIATIHGDHAGNTNDVALLRLVHQTDGDAQDTFLLCEDNSTGAAGNGDDMFKIAADGDVVMGGANGTGGRLQYSFEDLTVASEGTAASVEVVTSFVTTNGDADEDAVTLADGIKSQIKIFASVVETAGGDSYKITPTNLNGGSKITFDGIVGDGCTMLFDGTSWNIISNNGGVIS